MAPGRVRLSWVLEGGDGGQRGYQVRVAPGAAGLASGERAGWDSGRVDSAASADIRYAGQPLARGGRYAWQVRVWDGSGAASDWSEPAWFEVELDPSDWRASWIGLGRIRLNFKPPTSRARPTRWPGRWARPRTCGARSRWTGPWPRPGCT